MEKNLKLTIRVEKGEEFYMGLIEEIPEVITQGETVEETKENLLDALNMYLNSRRMEFEDKEGIVRENLIFT